MIDDPRELIFALNRMGLSNGNIERRAKLRPGYLEQVRNGRIKDPGYFKIMRLIEVKRNIERSRESAAQLGSVGEGQAKL